MASNRLRSLRNVGTRLNTTQASLSKITRRQSPRKLATNLVQTGNFRRYVMTEPVIAPNALTNEKFDDGSVDTPELADDAVTEPKLDIDAVTGKNVTSCYISDCDIENCRFDNLEGDNFTVNNTFVVDLNFDLTAGKIQQVDITGPSTFTGSDVIFSGVEFSNVTADTISGPSLTLSASGDIILNGSSGAIVNGGGGSMSHTGSFFSVSSGVGFNVNTSGATLGGSYTNFLVSGIYFMPYNMIINKVEEVNDITAEALAAIPPCGC